jgi:hypothetical protein
VDPGFEARMPLVADALMLDLILAVEAVCLCSFYAVKVLNVLEDAKIFVFDGEEAGIRKFLC